MTKFKRFYKNNEDDKIYWVDNVETVGEHEFTFDKKKIYNLFADYPHNLTLEEKEILNIANQFGFDNYERVGNWHGYEIYAPYKNNGSIPCIGEPVFILVKGTEIRVAEEKEWSEFITQLNEY